MVLAFPMLANLGSSPLLGLNFFIGEGFSEMPFFALPLSLWSPHWKRDTEMHKQTWDPHYPPQDNSSPSFSMLSTATNLSTILTSVYFKSCRFHASSFSSGAWRYLLPTVSIHSWFPCSLANCSALRKSALMVIVIKVCNTIRNFLYPHMVAIRGFSISNFIWYSSSDCQKVTNSLLHASVSKKAWRTTWLMHAYSILGCGLEAGRKAVYTWKQLGLTITSISLPCRHLSLPQSAIAFIPHSVLLLLSFTGIMCSVSLSSLLPQALVCDLACSAIAPSLDPENCVFLLMRKMAIWQQFPLLAFPFLFPSFMQLVSMSHWGPCNLFLTDISSTTRKLLVEGMGVMNLSEKLQTKDGRCFQHTKYASYFSCIAECRHFWPVNTT